MEGGFYIDDHATLFALIAREAVTRFRGDGGAAIRRAVAAYCMERGSRMAARCVADGEELTMRNYILYGEWDDPRGESRSEAAAFEPNYRTNVVVCGWREAWHRRGLLEYGKIYCEHADHYLVRGFNPELELRMGKILSQGGDVCEFDWMGCDFRDATEIARRRREKISRGVVRDFLYHCGHLLSTARRELIFEMGFRRGEEVISSALSEYRKIFGALKKNILIGETRQNFLPMCDR